MMQLSYHGLLHGRPHGISSLLWKREGVSIHHPVDSKYTWYHRLVKGSVEHVKKGPIRL